ncbi:hypothetical protein BDZ97DRAFT_1846639 [Flammula alnicola]|nr:hypothetical protein BDZ97DRAFT_1846639 [Flammula alnicola]
MLLNVFSLLVLVSSLAIFYKCSRVSDRACRQRHFEGCSSQSLIYIRSPTLMLGFLPRELLQDHHSFPDNEAPSVIQTTTLA